MNYNIHILNDASAVATEIANEIAKKALSAKSENRFLNIAVSGGSTPRLLFEKLATVFGDILPWEILCIFWVDERCVPPLHSESNYGMTYDTLLSKIKIPEKNIFRMKGESNPESEVIRYAEILSAELPVENNYPVLDLILLGMGDDGHTASIFPNQMHLNAVAEFVAVARHPVSGQKRITLTGNTIRNAREVFFMITGENKAEIFSEIIQKKPNANQYPAAFMGSSNGSASVYVDKTAASQL